MFFNGLHFSRCFAQLRIFNFINEHLLRINKAWQAHAKLSSAGGANSTSQALHGHAKNILRALARDLEGMPSQEQAENAIAPLSFGKASETFLVVQAALQKTDAIDLAQFTMELGALRAVILKLSLAENLQEPETASDIVHFNQLIDELLAAVAAQFSTSMDRSRNTLLAILGHDLRTPLGGIKMAADYLSMTGLLSEKQSEAVDSIKRCSLLMSMTISDLSEYAKSSLGGAIPLIAASADISSVCRDALSEVSAVHPDCEFRLEESGNLDAYVDGAKLRRAFSILLHNAVRNGTRRRPIELIVNGGEDAVIVQVINHGPVISDRELQSAFDPMLRILLGQEGQDKGSGTPITNIGTGLFIAKRIVLAHSGKIEAASSESAGTVFTVTLPRANKGLMKRDANALPTKA